MLLAPTEWGESLLADQGEGEKARPVGGGRLLAVRIDPAHDIEVVVVGVGRHTRGVKLVAALS